MIRNNEKPWLVSSAGDHQIDKIQSERYIRQYASFHPFPGVKASVEKKIEWIDDLNNTYEDIMEDSFYHAPAPNPVDFAKDVLYEHCPQDVRVDIVVDWDKFRLIANGMKDDEKETFLKNVPKYLTKTKDGDSDRDALEWSTFEESMTYLSDKCKITTSPTNKDGENIVVIASHTISKDSKAIKEMNKIIKAIGLTPYVSGATGSATETSNYFWGLDLILGRNMYTQDDETPGVVYWRMFLEFHKANMTEVEKAATTYKVELETKIDESEQRGNPKMYVLLKRKDVKKKISVLGDEDEQDEDEQDEEEEIPSTPDYVQPLWLPNSYSEHYRRIAPHFHNGEGETINIQQRLEKGNTDSGNIKIELFDFELEYVKSQQCLQEKFGAALALTKVAQDDNYWMHDNENPKKLRQLVRNLADLWKNDLLHHDDSSIGLGLEDGTETAEDNENEMSSSRELLYNFLETMAKEYRCIDDVNFDWKPKKNKRKTASATSIGKGNINTNAIVCVSKKRK